MDMVSEKGERIKEALNMCDYYSRVGASIHYIENSGDHSLTLHNDSMENVKVVADTLKEALFWSKKLDASDRSKELSSMNYYNEMCSWRDEAKRQDKIIDLMLNWISDHSDCPSENEGADIQCETRCSNKVGQYKECWREYFEELADGEIKD